MKHKLLLLLIVLGALLPLQGMAYDFESGGIYYNIKETTVEVTHGDNPYVGAVSIPSKVTYGESTYSVTAIGDSAFYHCYALQAINISNSVTSIGTGAFNSCGGMTDLTLAEGLLTIGEEAFYNCYTLRSVVIPSSVTHIGKSAFSSCSKLAALTINNNATYIDYNAFAYCTALTDVTCVTACPPGISGSGAFSQAGIQTLHVLKGRTQAFRAARYWQNFPTIVEDAAGEVMEINAYSPVGSVGMCFGREAMVVDLGEGIGKVAIATENVGAALDANGYGGYTDAEGGFKTFTADDVADKAKHGLTDGWYIPSATELTALITKGIWANSVHKQLELTVAQGVLLTMPSYTPALTVGCYAAREPAYLCFSTGEDMLEVADAPLSATPIAIRPMHRLRDGKRELWYISSNGAKVSHDTASGTYGGAVIVSHDYDAAANVGVITFDRDLKNIGIQAFEGCSNLQTIWLTDGLISISNKAFQGCSALQAIDIPESVERIGDYAFARCGVLQAITLPEGLTELQMATFSDCGALKAIRLPKHITTIPISAFQYCRSLASVELPDSLLTIDKYAFEGCYALQAFKIPDGVTNIELAAFRDCINLQTVEMPSSVTYIHYKAFEGCANIATVHWAASCDYHSVIDYTKSKLQTFVLTHEAKSIKDGDFKGFTALQTIQLPATIQRIGSNAFGGCSSLQAITIPENVTSIGDKAFSGCTSLATVTNYALVPQPINAEVFANYDATLLVCEGYADAYAVEPGWERFFTISDSLPCQPMAETTIVDKSLYTQSYATYHAAIHYERESNNTSWQALYVPFAINYEEWSADFDIAKVVNIIQYDDDDDGDFERTHLVVRKLMKGSTAPNYPYLIRAKQTGKHTLTMPLRLLYAAAECSIDCSSVEDKYVFTGTYAPITTMYANGYYAMDGGKLQQCDAPDVELGAMRWYMSVTPRSQGATPASSAKARTITILVEGEDDTAIATLHADDSVRRAYDLSGRRVTEGAKGISIMDGKKIIK